MLAAKATTSPVSTLIKWGTDQRHLPTRHHKCERVIELPLQYQLLRSLAVWISDTVLWDVDER